MLLNYIVFTVLGLFSFSLITLILNRQSLLLSVIYIEIGILSVILGLLRFVKFGLTVHRSRYILILIVFARREIAIGLTLFMKIAGVVGTLNVNFFKRLKY